MASPEEAAPPAAPAQLESDEDEATVVDAGLLAAGEEEAAPEAFLDVIQVGSAELNYIASENTVRTEDMLNAFDATAEDGSDLSSEGRPASGGFDPQGLVLIGFDAEEEEALAVAAAAAAAATATATALGPPESGHATASASASASASATASARAEELAVLQAVTASSASASASASASDSTAAAFPRRTSHPAATTTTATAATATATTASGGAAGAEEDGAAPQRPRLVRLPSSRPRNGKDPAVVTFLKKLTVLVPPGCEVPFVTRLRDPGFPDSSTPFEQEPPPPMLFLVIVRKPSSNRALIAAARHAAADDAADAEEPLVIFSASILSTTKIELKGRGVFGVSFGAGDAASSFYFSTMSVIGMWTSVEAVRKHRDMAKSANVYEPGEEISWLAALSDASSAHPLRAFSMPPRLLRDPALSMASRHARQGSEDLSVSNSNSNGNGHGNGNGHASASGAASLPGLMRRAFSADDAASAAAARDLSEAGDPDDGAGDGGSTLVLSSTNPSATFRPKLVGSVNALGEESFACWVAPGEERVFQYGALAALLMDPSPSQSRGGLGKYVKPDVVQVQEKLAEFVATAPDPEAVETSEVLAHLRAVYGEPIVGKLGYSAAFIDTLLFQVFGQMVPPSPILSKLWLGSQYNAANKKELLRLGVTHILNVTTQVDRFFPDDFVYKQIHVLDVPSASLLPFLPSACDFIDDALARGNGVLVHCQEGVSRSASVVIAYVMRSKKLSAAEATAFVKGKRRVVKPNVGFRQQLVEWERDIGVS